jgi:hypothetical protein
MRKTIAAVAAGLLLLAAIPALAAGNCGGFGTQSVDGPKGGNQSVATEDHTTKDTTQTATAQSSGN